MLIFRGVLIVVILRYDCKGVYRTICISMRMTQQHTNSACYTVYHGKLQHIHTFKKIWLQSKLRNLSSCFVVMNHHEPEEKSFELLLPGLNGGAYHRQQLRSEVHASSGYISARETIVHLAAMGVGRVSNSFKTNVMSHKSQKLCV